MTVKLICYSTPGTQLVRVGFLKAPADQEDQVEPVVHGQKRLTMETGQVLLGHIPNPVSFIFLNQFIPFIIQANSIYFRWVSGTEWF